MEGFADIEGPVTLGPPLWLLLLGGVLLALGILLAIRLRRRRSAAPAAPLVPQRSPHALARERLDHLRAAGGSLDAEPYTVEVSDIVRFYLESALQIPAREQTSEEFLLSLQSGADLPPVLREHMPAFLEQCDRVKFARQDLAAPQRQGLLETAETVIDVTDADLRQQAGAPASTGNS